LFKNIDSITGTDGPTDLTDFITFLANAVDTKRCRAAIDAVFVILALNLAGFSKDWETLFKNVPFVSVTGRILLSHRNRGIPGLLGGTFCIREISPQGAWNKRYSNGG